jgi:hypothetical protein
MEAEALDTDAVVLAEVEGRSRFEAPPSEVTAARPARQYSFGKSLGALVSAALLRPKIACGAVVPLHQTRVQVGASCVLAWTWRSLTPNQSFQPTSHSSLRSSCAAAELPRWASG